MRLISFAVISFLAITVSAVPPWTNLYQSLRSPPSTTTQSEQQSTKYNKHYRYYVKIRKGREDARIALELLLENQKRIADYNDTHDVKTGPSLGSCYNLGLLKGQIDHIPKEIEGLLAKWEKIKVDKHLSKDDLKTWKAEIKDGIRRCEKRYEIVKEILREHEHSQPIGVQARKFINLLLPNARVE
ncbi:hypothetical protein BASA83_013830 [Batrachochytrium salamandrivorans]|nr:hypothetical protein BASA83_013830 [Batrachochytrium salamandrivorans]